MARTPQLILEIVATDDTFELLEGRQGEPVWQGKCIHCNRALVVSASGRTGPGVTSEHIVPKTHGGDDRLENLALACSSCNNAKGRRQDKLRPGDPSYDSMVAFLQRRRRERWRAPAG